MKTGCDGKIFDSFVLVTCMALLNLSNQIGAYIYVTHDTDTG